MSNTQIKNDIAYHRGVMRKLARSRVKVAEIGGNQDAPFEQAFSNLAHAYLKDKAPSLLDYEVGFQLIDRNQENTKAIGVFGFKVGSQWLYAPVFFLNGDLKGHELLYLKSQDMFVPLKENWLNYILNRKPAVLGDSVTKNMARIGVVPPNLYQLSRSPHKYASADSKLSPWAQDATGAMAYFAHSNPKTDHKYTRLINLPDFLKKEGKAVLVPLLKTCRAVPKLASALDKFYGLNVVKEVIDQIKQAEAAANDNSVLAKPKCKMGPSGIECYKRTGSVIDEPVKNSIKSGALKIAVYKADVDVPSDDEFYTLSDKDRSTLLRDGVLIKDKRLNASIAYDVQGEMKLTNPTESGIYNVLVKPGKFEKCLVILGPYTCKGHKSFAFVMCVDGAKNWVNIHPSYVWTKGKLNDEEFRNWYDKLKDANSLSKGGTYVLLGPNGQGTLSFSVENEISDENGLKSYGVCFNSWSSRPRAAFMPERRQQDFYDDVDVYGGERITLTGRNGTTFRAAKGGDLYVPDGFKAIAIKDVADDDDGDTDYLDSSDPSPLDPGDMQDVQRIIMEKTAGMKIYHTGSEVNINGRVFTPLHGLVHLVKDHCLREKQARVMLKTAEQKKVARFRIKYADEYYDLQRSGPNAPQFPEVPRGFDPMTSGQYSTQSELEANIPIPGMSAQLTNRDIYRPQGPEPDYQGSDQSVVDTAQQAAASGQKEVFDTAMIGSLLKVTRDDSMVDRWLPDVMKGMDRLGRILMIFYWHQDEFADRYGESELPELEDGLRNSFEAIGDILLTLRQKTVDPYPDEISKVDLGPVSNM